MIAHALAVATSNAGKLAEFRELLAGAPVTLHALGDVAPDLVVIEDGLTFAANATKKARALADASSMLSLADDSGLEVDALGGAPGIFSARYAAAPGSPRHQNAKDADNSAKLVAELAAFVQKGGAPGPWPARFVCALSLVDPFAVAGAAPIVAIARCEGHVIDTPRGDGGFGYDPLFVPSIDGKPGDRTMAELGTHGKMVLSHRAIACWMLLPELTKLLGAKNEVIARLGR